MRVLLLVNEKLVPPEAVESKKSVLDQSWKTEYHVKQALQQAGFDVHIQGVGGEVEQIKEPVVRFKPNIVFNLLEEFDGEAVFDQNVVSLLEIMGVKYTGCNPTGLILARDKALSKKILSYHRIKTPKFCAFPYRSGKEGFPLDEELAFPLIVKTLNEEASMGISQRSIVNDLKSLQQRVQFIHENFQTDALVEEYIPGRELYVGVLGNHQPQALPVWELHFAEHSGLEHKIATATVKWNRKYREKHKIHLGPAKNLSSEQEKKVQKLARAAYKVLGLSGYARFDFRLSEAGEFYLLEANPNPDIGQDDEIASAAKDQGTDYVSLIKKIINLGIRWRPTP